MALLACQLSPDCSFCKTQQELHPLLDVHLISQQNMASWMIAMIVLVLELVVRQVEGIYQGLQSMHRNADFSNYGKNQ